jgi:hypothetical protein
MNKGKKRKKRYFIESPRMADRQNCIGCTPQQIFIGLTKRYIRYFVESSRMDRQTHGVY